MVSETQVRHAPTGTPPGRAPSIDLLRGVVMIIMALDHVRDFIHRGAMSALPTNLANTTPLLFGTRWITHLCAPAFALTAGLGAWLWWQNGRTRSALSRFLATRGLWLMALELVVMQLGYYFSWSPANPVLLLVLWSLGLSMVLLAALIWLPRRLLLALAVATILLHPLLDGITARQFGAAAGLWNILHQVGAFRLDGILFVTPYPVIPWVAIMAFGFTLGPLFAMGEAERTRRLWLIAATALAGFVIMRLVNVYGDPVPWEHQRSLAYTVISFLNVTKYPASPAFVLVTLGLALALLAAFGRVASTHRGPVAIAIVFGRVPLFYYIVHFFLAHLIATALAFAMYGRGAYAFAFLPYPSMGGPSDRFPIGFGFDLWVTYLVWLAVVVASYPLCRWFAGIKARRRDWWFSYL